LKKACHRQGFHADGTPSDEKYEAIPHKNAERVLKLDM
jgi:hypothetical protein